MTLRVWLHEGQDEEPGVEAWALEILGFATWAPSQAQVIAQLPAKLTEHLAWLRRHGHDGPGAPSNIDVVELVKGNEILFRPDREPATPAEIDRTICLLGCSRKDLLAELEDASDDLLEWDPPYQQFALWANWRTIRATLAHIANGETHYYLRNIGYRTPSAPATLEHDWRLFLRRSREEVVRFLEELESSPDLGRVSTSDHGFETEQWSVRKVLRRIVRHELLHWKSIRRIRHGYERRLGANQLASHNARQER